MRFFIYLTFNGAAYNGWQIQPDKPSVQQTLERALSLYTGEKIAVTGAGRTDSGVHAIDYVAHFDSEYPLSDGEPQRHIYKLNAILPHDIAVSKIVRVNDNAHARFDAISRKYKYYIHLEKDPFSDKTSHFFHYRADIDSMNSACEHLIGKQDFTSMAKLHSDTKTNICKVTYAQWESISDDKLCFTIVADRFLRNMVRAIVGSLLEVGRGKEQAEWIREVLLAKNRCAAGGSVPAKALFLCEIVYPDSCFEI